MTARAYFLGLLVVCYSGVTVTGALLAAGVVAGSAGPEKVPVFFAVVAVLCVAAAIAGDRLMAEARRQWDRHFNANGVSWAVVEAEQILRRTGERR